MQNTIIVLTVRTGAFILRMILSVLGAEGQVVGFDDIQIILLGTIIEILTHIRFDVVIGFCNTNVFSGCMIKSNVHGVAIAGILLGDTFNTRILLCHLLHNFVGMVGGAVVYANDFDVAHRLLTAALYAFCYVSFHVINRNNKRYKWFLVAHG